MIHALIVLIPAWFYPAALVFLLLLLFSGTRKLEVFLVRSAWKLTMTVLRPITSFIHKWGDGIMRAHALWLRNWGPRASVIPDVSARHTTKRG